MAATTHKLSRTFDVGIASGALNFNDAFTRSAGIQALVLTNMSDTSIVTVSLMDATAVQNADDMIHIGPMGQVKIAWRDSVTAIATVASKLEVRRDDVCW